MSIRLIDLMLMLNSGVRALVITVWNDCFESVMKECTSPWDSPERILFFFKTPITTSAAALPESTRLMFLPTTSLITAVKIG